MIKLGTNSIGKIYLGENSLGRVYLGSNLVFQSGGSPTPPVPSDLVFYDRLVFDGTAYIATGITPDPDSSFAVSIGEETVKGFQSYFTMQAGTSAYVAVNLSGSSNATNRFFNIYYGSSSTVSNDKYVGWSNSRLSFFLTPNRFGWGTTSYTFTKGSNNPSGQLVIGNNPTFTSAQPFTGSIGTFRVYGSTAQNATTYSDLTGNNTPYITLRPCTYYNEAGLWYVEGNTFLGSSVGTLSVYNNS